MCDIRVDYQYARAWRPQTKIIRTKLHRKQNPENNRAGRPLTDMEDDNGQTELYVTGILGEEEPAAIGSVEEAYREGDLRVLKTQIHTTRNSKNFKLMKRETRGYYTGMR